MADERSWELMIHSCSLQPLDSTKSSLREVRAAVFSSTEGGGRLGREERKFSNFAKSYCDERATIEASREGGRVSSGERGAFSASPTRYSYRKRCLHICPLSPPLGYPFYQQRQGSVEGLGARMFWISRTSCQSLLKFPHLLPISWVAPVIDGFPTVFNGRYGGSLHRPATSGCSTCQYNTIIRAICKQSIPPSCQLSPRSTARLHVHSTEHTRTSKVIGLVERLGARTVEISLLAIKSIRGEKLGCSSCARQPHQIQPTSMQRIPSSQARNLRRYTRSCSNTKPCTKHRGA